MYGIALPDSLFGAATMRDHDEELAKMIGLGLTRERQGTLGIIVKHYQPSSSSCYVPKYLLNMNGQGQ
jgi:hypothetical protein